MAQPFDVHRVPATWSGERMHEMAEDCWCLPRVEYRCDGNVITHCTNVRAERRQFSEDQTVEPEQNRTVRAASDLDQWTSLTARL